MENRKEHIFRDMNAVKPPAAVAGQEAEALVHGRWVTCRVHKVMLHRLSHLREWAWFYHITVAGEQVAEVHVTRFGWEIRSKAATIRGW